MTKLFCHRCGKCNPYDEPRYCDNCGASLVVVGDGVPTMGDEAEEELVNWQCMCRNPLLPDIIHRTDGPCYKVETAHEF